jgi:uncharacterized repeat protein (TIGR01451 family)
MKSLIWRTLLSGTAALASVGVAQAQTTPSTGTTAGTTITNQAQATFSVNGTPATVQSNVSTFKVDRKVDFTVVAQTGTTKVNLGQTGAVLTFSVTNKTNDVQDFLLDPDQQILGIGLLGTDNFDVANMKVYVDKNGNGTYEAGTDDQVYIDELKPDETATVFLVADVPNISTAQFANASLHVVAAAGGTSGTAGAALIATNLDLLDRQDQVDVVFADNDSDGLGLGDIARNGQGRAYAEFEVGARTVDLSIIKSSRVIGDGVNDLFPKALPGATVEYCLLVRNATLLVPASDVVLTDVVPANTTYVAGSIKVGGTCLLGGEAQDDDADDAGDGRTYAGSYTGGTRTVSATIPTVVGGGQVAAVFRVTIN